RRDRRPALDAVLLPLERAAVVPPAALAARHAEVGLAHSALDLLEDPLAKRLEVGEHGVGVRVLGLEQRANLWVVLRAQPLVRILERVTVVRAGDGALRRDGGRGHGGGSGCGHGSTLPGEQAAVRR